MSIATTVSSLPEATNTPLITNKGMSTPNFNDFITTTPNTRTRP
jgi:hypothetical protein